MTLIRLIVLILALSLWHNTPALAQPVEVQPLAFGKFAMSDNHAQYSVIMSPAGVETYPPKIHPFDQGQPAIFLLEHYPADTEMMPSIGDIVLNPVPFGAGPTFDLMNFTFSPEPPMTNGAGSLTLNVGATLRTDGSGTLYNDGNYAGTYTLTINY